MIFPSKRQVVRKLYDRQTQQYTVTIIITNAMN
jgi:hypothetical protein